MVTLVLLACVLRVTTKKVVNFFEQEKCTPEKILATPMSITVIIDHSISRLLTDNRSIVAALVGTCDIQGASTVTVIQSTVREVAAQIATTRPTDTSAVRPAPIPAQKDVSLATRRRGVLRRLTLDPRVTATSRRAVPLAENCALAVKVNTRYYYILFIFYLNIL